MNADDILFAPITQKTDLLLNYVNKSLADHSKKTEFRVTDKVDLDTYMQIVDAIENNSSIFRAARNVAMVDPGGIRPPGALTMRDVFTRLHSVSHTDSFYWTAPQARHGVEHYKFTNSFHIVHGLPTVEISTGGIFEWWILSLMGKFTGYSNYYCFGSIIDAQIFWESSP